MNNNVVQLTDNSGNNVYPIAGGATQGSISKSMLAEGVFEGPELSPPSSLEYVRTENIVDGAVTSDKLDWSTIADVVTNSNGTAIKFGNGLMICYKTFGSGDLTTDATYGATVWNFPATFITTPTFLAMPTRGSGDYGVYIPRVHIIDGTYAQCIWTNINNTPAAGIPLYYTGHYAIGRWK